MQIAIPDKTLPSGFKLPLLGIGTWLFGGSKERNLNNDDRANITAIQTAIELGYTLIDTAENYAAGHAEELIGKAISGYPRQKLIISSKVSPEHLKGDDLLRSFEDSLNRLRTDYLDLYLIHFPNPNIPLVETFRALNYLVTIGCVRAIGVSNFAVNTLQEAQKFSIVPILLNQVYYSLRSREPAVSGLLDYCSNQEIIVQAYRPLEKGAFLFSPPPLLKKLAQKYGKTPAQIALNWLLTQKNITALVKATKREHLEENLGVFGWELSLEDHQQLTKDFPDQIDTPENLKLA